MPQPPAHPRQHALTIAAAQHLHSAGHLSAGQRDAIHKDARKKLEAHKARKAQPMAAPQQPAPFGALAPGGPAAIPMAPGMMGAPIPGQQ